MSIPTTHNGKLKTPISNTAIVILNYNGSSFLKKFLPDVIRYSSDEAKIIVADNASTDDSIKILQDKFPQVSVIPLSQNYGFAGGYNEALKKVDATYYVLLNSDVKVTENWLLPLINFLKENEHVAACQPKIRSYHQKDYFEYAGAAGGLIDKFGYSFCQGRKFDYLQKDTGQYNEVKEIFWATGACLFIKAKLFHKAGGFDADFFAHMEEIDLCWRLKNMGYKIYYHPEALVYHVGGGTLNYNSPFKTYLNFRNNLFLLHKNLANNELFSKMILRLLLDGIAALFFLLKLQFKHTLSVFRAHLSYYKSLKLLSQKRKKLKNFPFYNLSGVYLKSIVWDYYIRKIK